MVRRGYLQTADGAIHYRAAGDTGDPLLLLHPTPASSEVYTELIGILGRQFQVVAMDTPGFGESDPPPRRYSIPDYAAAIVRVLDALGWEEAHVVGKLTGATLACEVAAMAPGRVETLVLAAIPDYAEQTRAEKIANPKAMVYEPDGSHIPALWRFLRSYHPTISAHQLNRMLIANLECYPLGEDAHLAVFQYDPKPRLPLIDCPTLLLYSPGDLFLEHKDTIRSLLRRPVLKEIPGSQLTYLESPDVFAAALTEFIASPRA